MNNFRTVLENDPAKSVIMDLEKCVETIESLIEQASRLVGIDLMNCEDYMLEAQILIDEANEGGECDINLLEYKKVTMTDQAEVIKSDIWWEKEKQYEMYESCRDECDY